MDNKIPRMKKAEENGECMACADCVAICPVQAISLKRPMILTRYFKTLDIGDLMPPRL
jgi:ferredoxin